MATNRSDHYDLRARGAGLKAAIIAALVLACDRVGGAIGDGVQGDGKRKAEVTQTRVNPRSLPKSLPADKVPSVYGCNPDRPESTRDQCMRWAMAIVEHHVDEWDRFARDTLVRLCGSGCGACCEDAAYFFEVGRGGPGGPSEEQGLIDEACRLGRRKQCSVNVERRRAKEGKEREELLRACEARDAVACLDYGVRLWDQDRSAAGLAFFDKACSLGNHGGCARADVARIALQGRGPW